VRDKTLTPFNQIILSPLLPLSCGSGDNCCSVKDDWLVAKVKTMITTTYNSVFFGDTKFVELFPPCYEALLFEWKGNFYGVCALSTLLIKNLFETHVYQLESNFNYRLCFVAQEHLDKIIRDLFQFTRGTSSNQTLGIRQSLKGEFCHPLWTYFLFLLDEERKRKKRKGKRGLTSLQRTSKSKE